jgi:hypothetical protein
MLRWASATSLFRALGLSLLYAAFSPQYHEEKKVALTRDRRLAAFRCMFHLFPAGLSIALAYLNINGYYIGGELAGPSGRDGVKLGALQFAAKMHELLINSSIAMMIMSYIRYELRVGLGLPFGALIAGHRFSELGYFWSLEFWGTVLSSSTRYSFRRKVCLIGAIGTATFLAATAAPSSAIAIMPQLGLWPCCGTSFWINASNETLWPDRLTVLHAGGEACSGLEAISNPSCPSGGFSTLELAAPFLRDRSLSNVAPAAHVMYGEKRLRAMNSTWRIGRNPNTISTSTSPMAAVADALGLADWGLVAAKYATFRDRSSSRYWFQRAFITTVHTNQPISRVRCELHFDSEPDIAKDLSFPDHWGGSILFPGSRNSTFFADANGVMGVESPFSRIHWLELPPTLFQNSTMGAIVALPTAAGSSSLTYLTCNIDSRWANSIIFPCGSGVYCGAPVGYDTFALGHTLLNWTWIAIRSDVGWASALNPPVQRSGYNTSTVAAVAHAAGVTSASDDSYPAVFEGILAMTFTDGLARLGNKASLQGSLKEAGNNVGNEMPTDGLWVDEWMRCGNAFQIDEQKSQAERWTQLRMETQVNGYAYSFDSITTKIAIIILMLHASLAVCHSIYEMMSGLSSSSWDSVAELLALAMNSSPTKTLQNTCAGISQLATMKLLVRVVATKVDHLELDFTSPSEEYELLSKDDVGKLVTAPRTVYPNSAPANAGTFEPTRLYGNVTTGASLETDAGAVRLRKSSTL